MKKQLASFISLFLFIGLMSLPVVSAEAADLRGGERMSISADETIEEDLYVGAATVKSAALINGDAFIAGGDVTVDGEVAEDLHAAGGSVILLGSVAGDARLVGGDITVSGTVGEDLVLVGGQTYVSGDGVAGDLVWAGGELSVSAPVDGDLKLYGTEAYISTTIAGDVTFSGQKLVLEEGASIEGDLSYKAPQKLDIADGAIVAGEITYEQTEDSDDDGPFAQASTVSSILWFAIQLAGALVIGLGLTRFINYINVTAFSRPWAELGRGFAVLIIAPIAAIILMISVLGMPFGILTLLGYLALLIVAGLVAPILLGALVRKWIEKTDDYHINWMTMLLGVALFTLLEFVPILGWFIQFIFILLAIGAITLVAWRFLRTYPREE